MAGIHIDKNFVVPARRLSWRFILWGGALELAIGVLGLGIAWLFGNLGELADHFTRFTWFTGLYGAGIGIAVALFVSGLFAVVKPLQRTRAMRLVRLLRGISIPQAALVSLAAGIGEELLFRGALQPLTGLWIAALLFAFAHPYGVSYIVFSCLAGIGLGFLYAGTDSLLLVICVHAMYDFTALMIVKTDLFRMRAGDDVPSIHSFEPAEFSSTLDESPENIDRSEAKTARHNDSPPGE